MDEILRRTLLFDFYGELLNEHRRRIYEEVVLNDYSQSEVALDEGITRQGIHDIIKRCDEALEGYENKLHLVEKYMRIRKSAEIIAELSSGENEDMPISERFSRINKAADDVLKEI